MPKPSVEFDSLVLLAIVPEITGLKNPAPTATRISDKKTVIYADEIPVRMYPAIMQPKAKNKTRLYPYLSAIAPAKIGKK